MSCAPIVTGQIAAIQDQIEATLVDSVIVSRRTATVTDGAGGLKPSSGTGWTTVTTISGLLTVSRLSPRERDLGRQINAPVNYDVYVAHGANVRTEDRLIINSRTFEVQGIAKAETWAILDRIYAVELQK